MSRFALKVDEVRPRLLELDGRVEFMFPDEFVAHEAVDAAVIGAFVRVLDETQGARALLQPCRVVGALGEEQLDDTGAQRLQRVGGVGGGHGQCRSRGGRGGGEKSWPR